MISAVGSNLKYYVIFPSQRAAFAQDNLTEYVVDTQYTYTLVLKSDWRSYYVHAFRLDWTAASSWNDMLQRCVAVSKN